MPVMRRRPVAPLAPFVREVGCAWGEQPETSRERILPDGALSLWVNLNVDAFRTGPALGERIPGAALDGPHDQATVIEFEAGRAHVWASFALGIAPPFFGAPPSAVLDRLVPVAELWGRDGSCLRERVLAAGSPEDRIRVLEATLLEHAAPAEPDPAIVRAVAALDRGARVSAVAAELGLLPRTFTRRFRAQVGMPPKRFARVRRLQRVVAALDGQAEPSWADVAAEHGYCDQAHLVDEFNDIAGTTPAAYLRDRLGAPNHVHAPPPPAG